MTYGKHIRLPGEFFDNKSIETDPSTFVSNLQKCMDLLKPVKINHKSARTVFVHKDMATCSHVFVRIDRLRKSLEPVYEGPFLVLERNDKYYTVEMKNRSTNINIDRLKPAYLLADQEDQNEKTESTSSGTQEPEAQPVNSTETVSDDRDNERVRTSRSGRKVRFPSKYLEQIVYI